MTTTMTYYTDDTCNTYAAPSRPDAYDRFLEHLLEKEPLAMELDGLQELTSEDWANMEALPSGEAWANMEALPSGEALPSPESLQESTEIPMAVYTPEDPLFQCFHGYYTQLDLNALEPQVQPELDNWIQMLKRAIGRDGCHLKRLTAESGVYMIWHNRKAKCFEIIGPEYNIYVAKLALTQHLFDQVSRLYATYSQHLFE